MKQSPKVNIEGERESAQKVKYETYYNNVLLKEEPFYRVGMTSKEAQREMDYLNEHLDSFYEGKYVPLWKQNLYK